MHSLSSPAFDPHLACICPATEPQNLIGLTRPPPFEQAMHNLSVASSSIAPHSLRIKKRSTAMARLEVPCTSSDNSTLFRPCVNCGKRTGNFCDGAFRRRPCLAAYYIPSEKLAQGQSTHSATHARHGLAFAGFVWGSKVRPHQHGVTSPHTLVSHGHGVEAQATPCASQAGTRPTSWCPRVPQSSWDLETNHRR